MNNIKMAKGLEIRSNTERVTIENNIVSGSTEKCDNLFDISKAKKNIISATHATMLTQVFKAGTYTIAPDRKTYVYIISNGVTSPAYAVTTSGYTFTTTSDFTLNLDIYGYDNTFKMMVNEGITKKDYQPYFEGLRYGYYKGLQLDNFSYIDKTNKIKHKGGKSISLNGNENWVSQYDTFGRFMLNIPDIVSTSGRSIDKFIITEFTPNINAAVGSKNEIMQGSNNIYIYPPEEIKTLEEWKTYLKYNPAILNYELATPSESGIEEF